MALTVRKLSDALGNEIVGLDLNKPIDDATFKEIYAAWLDGLVLVIRDQNLSDDAQIEFATGFGELWFTPENVRSTAETSRPEHCMMITNVRDSDGAYIGSLPDGEMFFHTDTVYTEYPSKASLLYAIDVPSKGGETRFLNMYKALEALPDSTRRLLEGQTATHQYNYGRTGSDLEQARDIDAGLCAHPAIITHPDTGKKALYVSRLMTQQISGMSVEESRKLLDEIFDDVERPEFIYEHKWLKGDLVIWDNRCVLHGRNDFDAGERRLMRRVVTNVEKRPAA